MPTGLNMDVYVVQHVDDRADDRGDVKLIGIYSTEEDARAAMARLVVQPGFRDVTERRPRAGAAGTVVEPTSVVVPVLSHRFSSTDDQ